MSCDWADLILTYLHDPPDRALSIRGQHQRALRYARLVLGQEKVQSEDVRRVKEQLASHMEHIPLPSGKEEAGLRIDPADGHLTVVHPLTGEQSQLPVDGVDEDQIEKVIRDVVDDLDTLPKKFLALWRLLSEALAKIKPFYSLLPGDTRVPDHTIWHHLDIAAGLKAALSGSGGAALLSFALAPVQPFIEAARSVRDLWSGSMILSWLTFRGMLPVIERYGPTALVFPSLRGVPLVDRWLREQVGLTRVPRPLAELLRSPCLPNRFLAVVPLDSNEKQAQPLAQRCREAVHDAWAELAGKVRHALRQKLGDAAAEFAGWDGLWDQQIQGYFSVTTTVLPLASCDDQQIARLLGGDSFAAVFPEAAAVRKLAEAIPEPDRPAYGQATTSQRATAGRWQAQLEISARLMEASRGVRHIPPSTEKTPVPGKCSLMGTFEQMGPARLEESRRFWETMAEQAQIGLDRVRKQERLCAVALTKRFAPYFLARELGMKPDDLRTPDTATVAAAKWLEQARALGFDLDPEKVRQCTNGAWSGQWLFWSKRDQEEDEDPVPEEVWKAIKEARSDKRLDPPPAYYAILMMDGDHMGRWLSGQMLPKVEAVLHPRALEYFRQLRDSRVEPALTARRTLEPACHAAISQALANFALHAVPQIVQQHHGFLVYAGGDDVLAMLPTCEAVSCAHQLRLAFSGERQVNGGARAGYYKVDERELLMMGRKATASCGLAVVHHKEDLRFALREARRTEKTAKIAGRDTLQITICRRSGEQTSVLCPWDFAPTVQRWIDAFVQKASDRWAYRLRADLQTIAGLPVDALRAELFRQVNRSDDATKEKLKAGNANSAGKVLLEDFDRYLSQITCPPRNLTGQQAAENFILLCQTASFLARGRTQE